MQDVPGSAASRPTQPDASARGHENSTAFGCCPSPLTCWLDTAPASCALTAPPDLCTVPALSAWALRNAVQETGVPPGAVAPHGSAAPGSVASEPSVRAPYQGAAQPYSRAPRSGLPSGTSLTFGRLRARSRAGDPVAREASTPVPAVWSVPGHGDRWANTSRGTSVPCCSYFPPACTCAKVPYPSLLYRNRASG